MTQTPRETALDALSAARSPFELREAHRSLKRATGHARAADGRVWGNLAATFHEAMRIWDAQRAEGVTLADRIRGMEATLRSCWPQVREWKYLCNSCDDSGAVYETRQTPMYAYPVVYVVPCHCSKGARFRAREPHADDFTAAGKTTKKPRDFSRAGR